MNKIEKIICKVKAKNYCVVHFKYLQQAISDTPQLTKAHKATKLKQENFLKPYIELNTIQH